MVTIGKVQLPQRAHEAGDDAAGLVVRHHGHGETGRKAG